MAPRGASRMVLLSLGFSSALLWCVASAGACGQGQLAEQCRAQDTKAVESELDDEAALLHLGAKVGLAAGSDPAEGVSEEEGEVQTYPEGYVESDVEWIRDPKCLRFKRSFPAVYRENPVRAVLVRFIILDPSSVAAPTIKGKEVGPETQLVEVHNGYETPRSGNNFTGFPQYSLFFALGGSLSPEFFEKGDTEYTVQGLLPFGAYVSLVVTYNEELKIGVDLGAVAGIQVPYTGKDFEVTTLSGKPALNPFQRGSPTLLSYPLQARCAAGTGKSKLLPWKRRYAEALRANSLPLLSGPPSLAKPCRCTKTNTEVFRLPANLSFVIQVDGGNLEGCSPNYLFSPGVSAGVRFGMEMSVFDFQYGFIAFKNPYAFNPFKDLRYRGLLSKSNPFGYELDAFTVSSHFYQASAPNLPYTVTSLMLEPWEFNRGGVAYVLFAPVAEVQQLSHPEDTAPPTVWLPRLGVRAYVLAAPDFAFIFRYRSPSPAWKGSPANAPCKATLPEQLEVPATCEQLGASLPQIFRLQEVHSVRELVKAVDLRL